MLFATPNCGCKIWQVRVASERALEAVAEAVFLTFYTSAIEVACQERTSWVGSSCELPKDCFESISFHPWCRHNRHKIRALDGDQRLCSQHSAVCGSYSVLPNSCPMQTNTLFFQLFIGIIFNSLQTSCNSAMIDLPIEYVWGTPSKITFNIKVTVISTRVFFTMQ